MRRARCVLEFSLFGGIKRRVHERTRQFGAVGRGELGDRVDEEMWNEGEGNNRIFNVSLEKRSLAIELPSGEEILDFGEDYGA